MEYTKKAKLNSKPGKYLMATQRGLTKEKAKIVAGYRAGTHPARIEETKTFKQLEQRYLKDELDSVISTRQVAQALADNIMQAEDIGGRNGAIKIYKEIKEPEAIQTDGDNVMIVFKQDANQE